MRVNYIDSADDLPKVNRVVHDNNLSDTEKKNFVFGETSDGRVYCLINKDATTILKKRAQTVREFFLSVSNVEVIYTSEELVSIFRDLAQQDSDLEVATDTDLDRRFQQILQDAVQSGASDIHFEIHQLKADIRFRINGMLFTVSHMDTNTVYRLVNFIYNVAASEGSKDTQFNIEEMQDALLDRQITINGERKRFKLRLQTAPLFPNSLTIVMRILPIDNQLSTPITSLGYSNKQLAMLKKAQMKPNGATIIAGTTGSGKSTTLATVLAELYQKTNGTKKILTAEDPPEYSIPGANQINVGSKKQVTNADDNLFLKAIKVAMRCDPDVIMVGEVRDSQSSQLLSSAVLSGHQVFTTVHASSGLAIFDRLIHMGFDRSVLTSPNFLSLLTYQTLVPVVCPRCSYTLSSFVDLDKSADARELIGRIEAILKIERFAEVMDFSRAQKIIRFAHHKGCNECRRGYIGRTVVAEMIEPDSELLEYFRNDQFDKGYIHWRKNGGELAIEHGIYKVLNGHVDPRSLEDRCGLLTSAIERL